VIALVLVGAAGRMGRAVEEAALASPDFAVKGRVDRADRHPADRGGWSDTLADFAARGDVVVEFSSPEGCRACAELCAARGAALVSGTTGLDAAGEAAIAAAAARVPVLRSANFSLGVAALRRALDAALSALPRDWDIEIVERHHRRKLDSPSGTALLLGADAAASRGLGSGALRQGRSGRTGPRPAAEIGIHAVRGGSWVGDHAVLLAGEGEWLELRHVASDRGAFAHGALAAARFVAEARPGAYTLDDVLSAKGR
jgi:4-hydroxy-tetrahydrodipicolinate reductase